MLDCKVKYASIQPSWGVWNEFYSGYMPIVNIIIHYRSSLKGSQWLIAGKQSSARVNFGTNFEIIILDSYLKFRGFFSKGGGLFVKGGDMVSPCDLTME